MGTHRETASLSEKHKISVSWHFRTVPLNLFISERSVVLLSSYQKFFALGFQPVEEPIEHLAHGVACGGSAKAGMLPTVSMTSQRAG
jgi:hypothetical protein